MFSHNINMEKLAEKANDAQTRRHDQRSLGLAFALLRNGCGYKTILGLKQTDWANDPRSIEALIRNGSNVVWCPNGIHAFDSDKNLARKLQIKLEPWTDHNLISDVKAILEYLGYDYSLDSSNHTISVLPPTR